MTSAPSSSRENPGSTIVQPAGEGLGGLAEQVGGGAAQYQETCTQRATVGQDPQDREQVRATLNLVDDHRPAKGRKRSHRLRQAGQATRVLEIEVSLRRGLDDLPGQGRLARLARPDQGHDGGAAEGGPDLGQATRAIDHPLYLTTKI